jgi:hypothetical protein
MSSPIRRTDRWYAMLDTDGKFQEIEAIKTIGGRLKQLNNIESFSNLQS